MSRLLYKNIEDRAKIEELIRLDDSILGRYQGYSPKADYTFLTAPMKHQSGFMSVHNPISIEFYRKFLKDSTLLDLGCGSEESYSLMISFAALCGVKKYGGINKFDIPTNYYSIDQIKNIILEKKLCNQDQLPEIQFANEDMLKFLSKQENNSANIVMFGIDEIIIPFEFKEYHQELAKQIAAVIPKRGFAAGSNTPHLQNVEKYGLTRMTELTEGLRLRSRVIKSRTFNNQDREIGDQIYTKT
ncbi:hypothetical protein HOK51_08660 [Candidatus Woesearchaeota archaeon]|jgi:hypothetical protein|nr:hypothetical protein [Candidatus Woesearchaeota archaeon]MBT6519898.1 hypothetical protein [Candidatus Woesearchaeota archaeon]MBT7367126.1 hypothetical protein [Candidatus Woesearchaeota archaeon]